MISFIETDPQALLSQALARFEQVAGETLYPGDERYLFLAQQVQAVVACRAQINCVANLNLLKNATGELLEEYGNQYDVTRIPAKYAAVKLRFSLAAPLDYPLEIPTGTRITPDGILQFLVNASGVIAPGECSVELTALAEKPGSSYNNFLPGQITGLVDLLPGIQVENLTASAGGTDEETDESYRERIRLSWEGLSTCGSKESYEYWARSASAEIADVVALSEADGEVQLYILPAGADTASEILLDAVQAAVSAEKRRPLTDKVQVCCAQRHPYQIRLTYYLSQTDARSEAEQKAAITQAVETYAAELRQHLGGQINPDALRLAILQAGGCLVELQAPTYTILQPQQVAVAEEITLEYGGML